MAERLTRKIAREEARAELAEFEADRVPWIALLALGVGMRACGYGWGAVVGTILLVAFLHGGERAAARRRRAR